MKTIILRLNLFSVILLLLIFLFSGCSSNLHVAAISGNLKNFQDTYNSGVDINNKNLSGDSPMHASARKGRINIVRFILENGGRVNSKNSFLNTPLHVSSSKGHLEIVKLLVANGGNIHSRNNHGNTPLILAAQEGHSSVVEYFISLNASFNTNNNFNETAKQLAAKNGHHQIISIIDKAQAAAANKAKKIELDTSAPVISILSPSNLSRGLKIEQKKTKVLISGNVTDENKIIHFSINGIKTTVSENGYFEALINLINGENTITVSAIDNFSNKGFREFTVTKRTDVINPDNHIEDKYYALIIGNNNYSHLPDLKTAVNDAVEIKKLLEEKYSFNCTLLLNAKKTTISRALNKIRKSLGRNDNLLIYYGGHGYFDKTVKKAYWWPVDAEEDDDTNWIIADTITTNIKRISSRHILVIADSCYSGTLTRNATAKMDTNKNRAYFLSKMRKKTSRTLMASGGNEPVSDEGSSGHSVFAAAFINGLNAENTQFFTAEDFFYRFIKEAVAGNSAQIPEYSVIRNSGHDGGDFIFRKL